MLNVYVHSFASNGKFDDEGQQRDAQSNEQDEERAHQLAQV